MGRLGAPDVRPQKLGGGPSKKSSIDDKTREALKLAKSNSGLANLAEKRASIKEGLPQPQGKSKESKAKGKAKAKAKGKNGRARSESPAKPQEEPESEPKHAPTPKPESPKKP